MEGHLLMSRKELERKTILELVKDKRITLVQACKRMHLGYRQTLRVYERFVSEGDAGLVQFGVAKRNPSAGMVQVARPFKSRHGFVVAAQCGQRAAKLVMKSADIWIT